MSETKEEYLRYADQQHAEALARLDHAIGYSRSGLHAALLANGGALIGLFTLIAPQRDLAAKLWSSGLSFSLALACTLVAWLLATAAQDRYQISSTYRGWNAEARAHGREPAYDDDAIVKVGTCCLYGAYGATTLAILIFIAGCLLALRALA